MLHGIGSLVVSTVFCVRMSHCMTNGFTFKRIQFELDSLSIGKIGRTKLALTMGCRTLRDLAIVLWQAKRLPYNPKPLNTSIVNSKSALE